MKVRNCLGTACAALLLSGGSVAQGTGQQETGNWTLERSPERCVISRGYETTKGPVTLGFKAPPLGDTVQIVIVRPARRTRPGQARATVTIDREIVRATALSYPLDAAATRAAHLINLSGVQSAALRRASELAVSVKVGANVSEGLHRTFALGPMAGDWLKLDACLERLRQTWNISEASTGLARPAQPHMPLGKLFSAADYPRVAIRKDQTGSTAIILLIDETGSVKDCTLTETSGIAVLDSATCSIILRRARFQPAIGPNGLPAKSAFRQRITWGLQ